LRWAGANDDSDNGRIIARVGLSETGTENLRIPLSLFTASPLPAKAAEVISEITLNFRVIQVDWIERLTVYYL
jgi:hypothetical protein